MSSESRKSTPREAPSVQRSGLSKPISRLLDRLDDAEWALFEALKAEVDTIARRVGFDRLVIGGVRAGCYRGGKPVAAPFSAPDGLAVVTISRLVGCRVDGNENSLLAGLTWTVEDGWSSTQR